MKLTTDHLDDLEKLIDSYSPPYSEEKVLRWGKRKYCVLCQRAGDYNDKDYPRCKNCMYRELTRRKRIIVQDRFVELWGVCAHIVGAPEIPVTPEALVSFTEPLPLSLATSIAIKADKRREWLINTIRPILIEEVEKDSKESTKTYSVGDGFVLDKIGFHMPYREPYVLAQVGSHRVCLISLYNFNRFSDPVIVVHCTNITEEEFSKMCGSSVGSFVPATVDIKCYKKPS